MIGIHTGNFSRELPSQLGGIQHQHSEEHNGQTIRIFKKLGTLSHRNQPSICFPPLLITCSIFVFNTSRILKLFTYPFTTSIIDKLFPSPFTISIIGNLFPIALAQVQSDPPSPYSWHCFPKILHFQDLFVVSFSFHHFHHWQLVSHCPNFLALHLLLHHLCISPSGIWCTSYKYNNKIQNTKYKI